MSDSFRAVVAEKARVPARVIELRSADLPDDDTLVCVSSSTLNYKDGLAVTGKAPICKFFPMVCGIDLAGTVVDSRNPEFASGDRVLVNGFGLSETHWGGYSEKQRVSSDWLVRIPDAFTPEQAMGIGTAGYTSMLCVQALLDRGVATDAGPVLVTGASGGVGSIAVMLLARLGFDVVAASGRAAENEPFLTGLGAARLIERDELSRPSKPLESQVWAGVVDCVGGEMLATAIAQTRYGGTVAVCGLAGSTALQTTMLPFILRGVSLAGVDSVMASIERRQRAWNRLAELVDPALLKTIYTVAGLSDAPELGDAIIGGQIKGRVVIDVAS